MKPGVYGASRSVNWSTGFVIILGLCLIAGGAPEPPKRLVVDFSMESERAGVPPDWKLSTKEGTAHVAVVKDGGGRALRLRSYSSSFAVQKEVDIDVKRTPLVVWEWKVTQLPKRGDLRQSSTDDQAAQLFVMFSPDFLRTDVIAYVWDSTAPAGTVVQSPSLPLYPSLRIKAVVVRSGKREQGKWITETRNVVEDYKNLFGGDPDKVTGIRFQINSQHTKSVAESYWRLVTFQATP
jgi:hypothetical protein